jgi:hypothetical protein
MNGRVLRRLTSIGFGLLFVAVLRTSALADDPCDGVLYFERVFTGDRGTASYHLEYASALEACAVGKITDSTDQYTFNDRAALEYMTLAQLLEPTNSISSFIAYVRAYDLTTLLRAINKQKGIGSAQQLLDREERIAAAIRRVGKVALPIL